MESWDLRSSAIQPGQVLLTCDSQFSLEGTNLNNLLKQLLLFWFYPVCSLGNTCCPSPSWISYLLASPRDKLHLVNVVHISNGLFAEFCSARSFWSIDVWNWKDLYDTLCTGSWCPSFSMLMLNVIRCQYVTTRK